MAETCMSMQNVFMSPLTEGARESLAEEKVRRAGVDPVRILGGRQQGPSSAAAPWKLRWATAGGLAVPSWQRPLSQQKGPPSCV